jgi:hypothetical protein
MIANKFILSSKKVLLLVSILFLIIIISGCVTQLTEEQSDNSNIVIEDGEICQANSGVSIALGEAMIIAGDSECVKIGAVKEDCNCNEHTATCWLDIDLTNEMKEEKSGCSPACVVSLETREAEINWRCTGAVEPE